MGWRQAVVYGRRKAANFHWAEDGSGQPPLAACEQEWTLYVRLVWTCSGSRAGHQNKEAAVCVCTSTRSAPGVVTKEAEQNWSKCNFHFCYSEREKKKKKKLPLSETLSSVRFFFLSIFKAGTVNSSSFDRLPLKFYKHSLTKRIMEDILQSTKYIQTAVT